MTDGTPTRKELEARIKRVAAAFAKGTGADEARLEEMIRRIVYEPAPLAGGPDAEAT
jgi:hypothetical protein